MSIMSKLSEELWNDENAELPPEGKLAMTWVLTNKGINNLGYQKISRRQFEFDTRVSFKVLEEALKSLPRSFVLRQTPDRLEVLAPEFIHIVFSDAVNNPRNNMHKHLVNLLLEADEWVQESLLRRYKGLARTFKMEKGLYPPPTV